MSTPDPAGTAPAPPAPWPFGRSPALLADPIVQGVVFVALVSGLFLAWPDADLRFTGLFYADGFLVAQLDAFRMIRRLGRDIIETAMLLMLTVVVIKLVAPNLRTLLRPRDMLFSFLALALAPGLLVNGLFKTFSGRPRPVQVEAFGGDAPFVGVWQITDHCASNCSFVSGEASAALWMVTLAVFLPAALRGRAIVAILALGVVLSLNRVAFGGHFLSDVMIAWGLTLIVIVALHRWLYAHTPTGLTDAALDGALARAGNGVRQLVRGLFRRLARRRGDKTGSDGFRPDRPPE